MKKDTAAFTEIFSSSSNIYEVISNTDMKYEVINIDNKRLKLLIVILYLY